MTAARTMHTGVVNTLAREIVDGVLPEGAVLSLASLQSTYSISRTVAREVMRMLESVGLVTPRRRVGLVVQPRARWNVLDTRVIGWRLAGSGREAQLHSLIEVRAAVEPVAAAAAARDADQHHRDRLVALADRLAAAGTTGTIGEFLDADIEFHALLLRASGNEMFVALSEVFAVTLAGRLEHGMMPPQPRAEAVAAHVAVASAVAKGRSADAFDAMVDLLSELRTDLFS